MIVLISFIGNAQYEQVGQTLEGLGLNEGYSRDLYGYNTALSGDGATMAVAAIGSDMMVDGEFYFHTVNYVQVFRMIDGEWQQIGDDIVGIYDPSFDSYSRVGKGLALSEDGNTLVVGETYYRETLSDGTYLNGGRVKVLRYENEEWVQIGDDIIKSEFSTNDFGEFVDINSTGDVIAIGYPGESIDNYPQYGLVSVYQNLNDEWVLKGETLYGENPNTFLGYGVSLSADGNRMAVGIGDGPLMIFQAYARIYDFINGEWTLIDSLSREYLPEEYSVVSISLSGDGKRLAIGNSGFPTLFFPTPPDSHYGHVTIFEENEETEWEHIHTIDGEYFEFIGFSVDLSWDGKSLATTPYIGNENKMFQEIDGQWNHIGSIVRGNDELPNTYKITNSRDGSVVAFGNFLSEVHGEAYAYQNCGLSEINVIPGENSITCQDGTTLLTAEIFPEYYANTGSVKWYDSEDGTVPVFVGNEFETSSITENTTFWVEAVTAGGCASVRLPVEVSLYPNPILELDDDELGICEGNSAVLSVSSDGNTINWYDNEDATTPIFTGTEFETPELYENTSYWVEALSDEGCLSERIEITVTVNQIPDLAIENNTLEICEGTSAILTATASAGTVNWYAGEDSTEILFTGTSFETPELTETTSYWVEAENLGCITERQEITVTVLPAPELLIHETEVEICIGSSASLFAESPNNVIFWYANEDDTEYLYHGNLFVTEELTEDTTYWVEAYNLATGCRSERIEVTVTVNAFANLTVETTQAEVCSGYSVTLIATSSSTVNWYDSEDGTTPIFTGTEFTTPALFATTSYWVGASGSGECASERIEIPVTVIPSPSAPIVLAIYIAEEGQTLADLEEDIQAEGELKWYADEDLTIELPNTTPVEDEVVYYVTQTVNGCESEPAVVPVQWLGASEVNSDTFAYYPNPVKDRLHFSGSVKVESVQVFDFSGRLLISKASKADGIQQLDVTVLSKGTYVVKAQTDKGLQTFKIVKR